MPNTVTSIGPIDQCMTVVVNEADDMAMQANRPVDGPRVVPALECDCPGQLQRTVAMSRVFEASACRFKYGLHR